MRVLHLTSSFPRWADDASAPYLLTLARVEAAAGHEVQVLAPHDAQAATGETIDGVLVHRFCYAPDRFERLAYRGGLPAGARTALGAVLIPIFFLAFLVRAITTTRRIRPDVVHAHWWLPAGAVGAVVARTLGVPLVITLHGSDVHLARGRILGWLARRVLRSAAVVGAASAQLAGEAAAIGGGIDVSILRMPVEVPIRAAPQEPRPEAPPGRRTVVAAGRLTPEKGFDVLVAAAALLGRTETPVDVELIGDGPLAAELLAAAERSSAPIVFSAACSPSDLYDRIAQADALVVPSRREGLGLTAVEAMALGRPVIASRVGGLVETVEDGVDGILVPPDDPAALAAALSRLPLAAPRGRAVLLHSSAVVLKAHLDAYERAMTTAVPRWRPWRLVGVLVAAGFLFALGRLVARDWVVVRSAWAQARPVPVALTIVLTVLAEIAFAAASALALRAVVGRVVGVRRAAAAFLVGQNAEHVPGAVWLPMARAGLARRWGVTARQSLAWMATESVASVSAGGVLAAVVLATTTTDGHWAWLGVALAAACAPIAVARRSPVRRLGERVLGALPTSAQVGRAGLAYAVPWALSLGAAAAAAGALADVSLGDALALGAAAGIASIVGFLALPVPAGLGVRELVFAALAAPIIAPALAASIALGTRVLSTVVQIVLGMVAIPSLGAEEKVEREAGIS